MGAINAPEWERLFVQGVGNAIQGWQAAKGLSLDRAAELETFMNDRTSRVGSFLGRMARFGGAKTATSARDIDAEPRADAAVTGAEQQWLYRMIGADSEIDPAERALLIFLSEER